MHDRGEAGTSTEKPGNNYDSYFDAEQHCGGDHFSHGAPCGWMPGGGRGRRRAMMMAMMSDPSGVYGMDHGHRFGGRGGGGRGHRGGWFGFGGRGGGRGHHGGWFGSGDRGQRHGHGGRGRGRNGRGSGRFFVDDDDEYVTSMAEQMGECHLKEGRKRDGSGSSESSSSSSSSESDDEQNAPDVDVQGRQPHDGEVIETEGQAQQETTKSTAAELEKEKASSQHTCHHGKHGCRNGRGHHKHHHGKHKHHCHNAPHHSMIPPQMPPHLRGFNRPPFPPGMHHSHHRFSDCHGNRHMAKKVFKKSMKHWVKSQKKAWKQQQGNHYCHHHRRQRSDEDELVTSGCDNDDDFELHEGQCQLPPPWLFFPYDHHGCGHGRRGFGRHEKKGKKNGKRLRKCNGGRPSPAEDTSATKTQVNTVDDVEKVHEVHDECEDDQAPMEEAAE